LAREVFLGLWNQFVIPVGRLLHWAAFSVVLSACQLFSLSAFALVISAFALVISAFQLLLSTINSPTIN